MEVGINTYVAKILDKLVDDKSALCNLGKY